MMIKETYFRRVPMATLLVAATWVACVGPQVANAQLIAYDGFDYDPGDLGTVALGPLGGGTGWRADGETFWRDADGWISKDGIVNEGNTSVVDNPADWGYTDSQGMQLDTTGGVVSKTNWDQTGRVLDLSNVDPDKLTASIVHPDVGTGLALGAGGTEVWISYLGQGVESQKMSVLAITDGFAPDINRRVEIGRPWGLLANGTLDPGKINTAWGVRDLQPGPATNETLASTGNTYTDKVFFVARIQYNDPGDPLPGDAANVEGDELMTVWVDPDLGSTAPSEGSAAISDFVLWNHTMAGITFDGNADTFFDELRVGFTYADVAPIALPGLAGDFDFDNDVDGADFLVWQQDLGDAGNLDDWNANFGTTAPAATIATVPEPTSLLLASVMAMMVVCRRGRSI